MTTTARKIIRDMGIDAHIEVSLYDASLALDRSIPRDQARALVAALTAAGIESSSAPDHDDRAREWVYVSA